MIHICPGHEHSISLEILLKSLAHLTPCEIQQIILHVEPNSLAATCQLLNLDTQGVQLRICDGRPTISTATLLNALQELDPNQDLLITLPTTKDQLIWQNQKMKGYTEFLRHYFNNPNLVMCFQGVNELILLITDHIPLRLVSTTVTAQLIREKVQLFLTTSPKFLPPIQRILFSGLNPHAGENGLLGDEDQEIVLAIHHLQRQFPHIIMEGPYSGDALGFYQHNQLNNLLVYMYHDQGLSYFKGKHGIQGCNLTIGLPFLRMSTDHGVASDLYGKNSADYRGLLYVLRQALAIHQRQEIERRGEGRVCDK